MVVTGLGEKFVVAVVSWVSCNVASASACSWVASSLRLTYCPVYIFEVASSKRDEWEKKMSFKEETEASDHRVNFYSSAYRRDPREPYEPQKENLCWPVYPKMSLSFRSKHRRVELIFTQCSRVDLRYHT